VRATVSDALIHLPWSIPSPSVNTLRSMIIASVRCLVSKPRPGSLYPRPLLWGGHNINDSFSSAEHASSWIRGGMNVWVCALRRYDEDGRLGESGQCELLVESSPSWELCKTDGIDSASIMLPHLSGSKSTASSSNGSKHNSHSPSSSAVRSTNLEGFGWVPHGAQQKKWSRRIAFPPEHVVIWSSRSCCKEGYIPVRQRGINKWIGFE
jgi:hypothetical protein